MRKHKEGKRPFIPQSERRPPTSEKKPESGFDLWLQRSSHFSQALLVLAAIFGYFYTVKPIHQKELLDEQIAQSTAELKSIRAQYDASYALLRKDTVSSFARRAAIECTGLLDPPRMTSPPRPEPWIESTNRNVPECLTNQAAMSSRLKQLRASDISIVERELEKIRLGVSAIKKDFKLEVARINAISDEDLPLIPSADPATPLGKLQQLYERAGIKSFQSVNNRRKFLLDAAARAFDEGERRRIASLEDISFEGRGDIEGKKEVNP